MLTGRGKFHPLLVVVVMQSTQDRTLKKRRGAYAPDESNSFAVVLLSTLVSCQPGIFSYLPLSLES